MTSQSHPVVLTAEDRLAIADALYRLGAGIDENSADLIASSATADAAFDFGPAARSMGIDFPPLVGRDAIVAALTASVGLLDTTHVAANPRIEVEEGGVVLRAVVEAAHFPPGDHSRRCVMKNRYAASMRREEGRWRIADLVVECAWFDGDPAVLLGR